MFHLLLKDLRVSPLRTFLTGFSMFVGIIAMIAAVLVGTLGRDALLAVNAQLLGYTPMCSLNISQIQFNDYEKIKLFFERLDQAPGDKAIVSTIKSELKFASLNDLKDMQYKQEQLYCELAHVDTIYTTSSYNKIYNMTLYDGRWLCSESEATGLELVVNKAAAQIFTTSYVVASPKDTLALIPINKVGIVNDGKDWPVIYVNILPLIYYMPNILSTNSTSIYWHSDEVNVEMIQSYIDDLLFDSIKGNIADISVMDSGENYDGVIDMLQLGLSISAALLLFVSVLGQINIGLASLEQRTHELLIRRALGATKWNISMLVLGSQFMISVFVCVFSIIFAMLLVNTGGLLLPKDSPVAFPGFPFRAAFVAIIVSILTALMGGVIPAIKASRLEPALVLR